MAARDIQNFAPGVYAESVPALIGDQHKVLLDRLEAFLSSRERPTLLVLGPGAEVLPYSFDYVDDRLEGTRRDRVRRMLGLGRMVLIDLSDDENSGLARGARTLEHCGFFEPGYFRKVLPGSASQPFVPNRPLAPEDYPPGSIIFVKQNLRDPLLIAAATVDAVDATLCLHHVTQTRSHLALTYARLRDVLKPGGLLHLCEGGVDMASTEDKILKVARHVAETCGSTVAVSDLRDPSYPYRLTIGKNDAPDLGYAVQVTADGMILIGAGRPGCPIALPGGPRRLAEQLKASGYPQMLVLNDTIVLPLVDPNMMADRYHIDEVNRFYDAVVEQAGRRYKGPNANLVNQLRDALNHERGNATRGVVEYYQSEEAVIAALTAAGFVHERTVHQAGFPGYNVIARKPAVQ